MPISDDFYLRLREDAAALPASNPDANKPIVNRRADPVFGAGQRVAFVWSLESVVANRKHPPKGAHGTVVMVRTAAGNTTVSDGVVYVRWDDGTFMPFHHRYLKPVVGKVASGITFDMGSSALMDQFLSVTGSADLVHKATKDLWAVEQDGDAVRVVRLFGEDGSPLKV